MNEYLNECGDLIRVKELAKIIRLSRARTYALINTGEIPSVRVGGGIRVPRQAYDQWLKTQTAKALATTASGTAADDGE